MWKNFLKWLLKFALARLGADVDAETQRQLNDYERRRAAVERARDEAEIRLGRIEHERLTLEARRVKNSHEIEFLEEQIKAQNETLGRLNDEKNKKIADIRAASDDDILRSEL